MIGLQRFNELPHTSKGITAVHRIFLLPVYQT